MQQVKPATCKKSFVFRLVQAMLSIAVQKHAVTQHLCMQDTGFDERTTKDISIG